MKGRGSWLVESALRGSLLHDREWLLRLKMRKRNDRKDEQNKNEPYPHLWRHIATVYERKQLCPVCWLSELFRFVVSSRHRAMLTSGEQIRIVKVSGGRWSRANARVNARVVGLRRHLRVLPSRTRPSLYAGD